ncbi:MAG: hypothetical protein JWM80_5561 [Cyanobacteria bacterium RYN_339]|nr:hypothetical protein [Cyanobacteria bacterium RYN_339]
MAKKTNPERMKRARNAAFVREIRRKQKLKAELRKWKLQCAARALRVTLIPDKRHSQVVAVP